MKLKKGHFLGLGALLLAVFSVPLTQLYYENEWEVKIYRDLFLGRLGLIDTTVSADWLSSVKTLPNTPMQMDETIRPFKEIGSKLDDLSKNGSISFISIHGATVFDANGDGKLDLFFPNDQRPMAKRTTDTHLLTNETIPTKPNVLYLNQGNDAEGNPVFKSVQELSLTNNETFQREELIFEGKYKPRNSAKEETSGIGRIGWGAISADFNGDGLIDLYVLNGLYGMPYQTAETAFPIYPAGTNIGREVKSRPLHVRVPSFLRNEKLEDGMNVMVNYGGTPEPEGRNTLYLNTGDKDNDGLPEWEDATDSAGIGGKWASVSASVADYDRDGDLDIYVANFLDPDFFGFGTAAFSGSQNQLYKNTLVESGKLAFVDVAEELKVAGLHEQEGIAHKVYNSTLGQEIDPSEQIVDGRLVGQKADHTWGASFFDWNADGWMDLVVANDIGSRMRIYKNLQGIGFEYLKEFDGQTWEGCWMGTDNGDLDGDGIEELLATNCGSQIMSLKNTRLLLNDYSESSLQALATRNYVEGRNTMHHELLQFSAESGFKRLATSVKINHSTYIPPDQSSSKNIPKQHLDIYEKYRYADSLAGIEFAWNAPFLDVDNDGDLDIYFVGAIGRGNDGSSGDFSANPGRMLVNESTPGKFAFKDLSVEYQLLDIRHVDYSHNPPRRPSPGTGWHKRDYVYLTDIGSYAGMGVDASNSEVHEIFNLHEQATLALPADLNADGYEDIVVTHIAGYNSNSPDTRNLQVEVMGRKMSIPAMSKLTKPPTSFEYGYTSVYINGGAPKGKADNWAKVLLHDSTSYNKYGIGAKILANGRLVKNKSFTNGYVSGSVSEPTHIGLGEGKLTNLRIFWGSGSNDITVVNFDKPVTNKTICIDRVRGEVACDTVVSTLLSSSQ